MNTSGFHQNVGEGNKSLNAMSPDPLLNEAFGKGSGCVRLGKVGVCLWIFEELANYCAWILFIHLHVQYIDFFYYRRQFKFLYI